MLQKQAIDVNIQVIEKFNVLTKFNWFFSMKLHNKNFNNISKTFDFNGIAKLALNKVLIF